MTRLRTSRWLPLLAFLAMTASCGAFTDAATRIAYDIEAGVGRVLAAPFLNASRDHIQVITPEG